MTVRATTPRLPARFQAVLVTSANALAGLPVLPVRLLAVGDATAEKARAAGFARVESAAGDAVALARLAAERLEPADGPVLLASGRGQGAALAAMLRARGFRVARRVTYEAAPVQAFPAAAETILASRTLYAGLFMSTDTARAFVGCVPRELYSSLENVLALAIGKGVADALKPLPWRTVRQAPHPTLSDVLALL